MIVFSLVFDFLDGMVARLLKAHSELGKQLDSLADLVSFGVAPGFLMYKVMVAAGYGGGQVLDFLPFLGLLIPIFSALRLAKFNIDTRQTDYFIGLPTPANTILIFSIGLMATFSESEVLKSILLNPFFLTIVTLASSILLVIEWPLISLKLKHLKWQGNEGRFLLVLITLVLIAVLRFKAALFVIPLYLLLSLIFKPKKT